MGIFTLSSVLSCLLQLNSFHLKDYPYHPKIHTLSNIGLGGIVHAKIAPYVTKIIDYGAYNNRNVRDEIYKKIINDYPQHPYILDLCCGVGMSTPTHKNCIGIDTSKEMINEAKILNKNIKDNFFIGNAETVHETINFKDVFLHDECFDGFDITTIFFGFHEMPQQARQDILIYNMKYTKDKLIIVDIDPKYNPSKLMLYGEPYLFDYRQNIKNDLYFAKEDIIIKNHVIMWTIDCNSDIYKI